MISLSLYIYIYILGGVSGRVKSLHDNGIYSIQFADNDVADVTEDKIQANTDVVIDQEGQATRGNPNNPNNPNNPCSIFYSP